MCRVAVLEGGNDEAAGDGSADGAATGAVAAAQFPRIFITTSMNDTRVLYVEPLKWLGPFAVRRRGRGGQD